MALMTPTEKTAFEQCVALADFRKSWKTRVYYSLRAKEAKDRLEQVVLRLAQCQGGIRERCDGTAFWLDASSELMKVLQTVWSSGWYLDSLYVKFTQLTLELVARYGAALRGLSATPDADGAPAWDKVAASPSWSLQSAPARLPFASSDLLQVLAELRFVNPGIQGLDGIAKIVLAQAPGGPDGKPAGVARKLFEEAATGLRPVLVDLEAAMLQQLAKATTPEFAAIRGIPQLYRMLNKPVPTSPCLYVNSSMQPIQAFHVAAAVAAPRQTLTDWVQRAIDLAAGEFTVQALQLLEQLQREEASLRRLAGRSGAGDAQVSDLDKIHIQLCLDVDAFVAQAVALGAQVDKVPSLLSLSEAVAPARKAFEMHSVKT